MGGVEKWEEYEIKIKELSLRCYRVYESPPLAPFVVCDVLCNIRQAVPFCNNVPMIKILGPCIRTWIIMSWNSGLDLLNTPTEYRPTPSSHYVTVPMYCTWGFGTMEPPFVGYTHTTSVLRTCNDKPWLCQTVSHVLAARSTEYRRIGNN